MYNLKIAVCVQNHCVYWIWINVWKLNDDASWLFLNTGCCKTNLQDKEIEKVSGRMAFSLRGMLALNMAGYVYILTAICIIYS